MKFKLNENNTKLILKESTREEYNQIKHTLYPYVKDYRFKPKFKLGQWNGKYDYFNNGYIDFGLWNVVYEACKEYGYPFEIINKEQFPRDNSITKEDIENFCKDFYKDHKNKDGSQFMPYEHQIDAVYKILKHQYGRIRVATSGGKSLIFATALFYLLRNKNSNFKALLIVPSILLVTQFYDEIMDYNLGLFKENKNPIDLKMLEIMSDKPRKVREGEEPNICIGTYQSLVNYGTAELFPNFYKYFDYVCCDESHLAKSSSLLTILRRTFGIAKYRFGMSGTFPDQKTMPAESYAIDSVTGPIVCSVKARELMDKGLITNVKIKALILQYEDFGFAESIYAIKKNGGGKQAHLLEKKYAQKSEKRKIFVSKLVNKFKNNSLVLFYNIEYGTELYNYLRSNVIDKDFYYIDGETPKEKRDFIKKQMEITDDGKPKILIASFGTLAVGVSIKAIRNLVLCDSFKSTQLVLQSIGRVLRLHENKEIAVVFDLVDQFHHKYKSMLMGHYEVRKKEMYEKEQYPFEEMKILL